MCAKHTLKCLSSQEEAEGIGEAVRGEGLSYGAERWEMAQLLMETTCHFLIRTLELSYEQMGTCRQ